jgi:chromosomal replication initiator protein
MTSYSAPGIINKKIKTIDEWIYACCEILGADVNLLKAKTRKREIVEPRYLTMALLYHKGFKLGQIGIEFNRDHTTVIHAKATVESLCFTDPRFKIRKEELFAKIKHL